MDDIEKIYNNKKFKLRVSAIILQNNNILLQKGKKFDGFCFPGGHVKLGETTQEAIKREIFEELNVNLEFDKLFCIHENIYEFNNKISQEINYYYILKIIKYLIHKVLV